jgi:hypothetical protein
MSMNKEMVTHNTDSEHGRPDPNALKVRGAVFLHTVRRAIETAGISLLFAHEPPASDDVTPAAIARDETSQAT